jgi:hypothetical protein
MPNVLQGTLLPPSTDSPVALVAMDNVAGRPGFAPLGHM